MAISDSEYKAWLSNQSAIRCVLVEATVKVGGSEIVRYMSNRGYVTGGADSPANTVYEAIISGGVKLTESISIDASPTISFGDIEIDNTTGRLDSWLNDIWDNRSISVYYGDVKWARSDFRRVLKATCGGISSSSRTKLNLLLRDDLQKLNVSVTTTLGSGDAIYGDKVTPLLFGECFNISPRLLDDATSQYKVHTGAIEDILDVRDNGVPVAFTKDLVAGNFTLASKPVGTVTASVQGARVGASYKLTLADVIDHIKTTYGNTESRAVAVDAASMVGYTGVNYPVGLFLNESANLLATLQYLAGSVNAQLSMSRQGELQVHQINFPPIGSPTLINKTHIVEKSLAVDSKTTPISSVVINCAKNYTVQSSIQTAIPQPHIVSYATEWLPETATDSTAETNYKLYSVVAPKNTLLISKTDAAAEATRRLDVVKVPRTIYKMTCFSSMLDLELGQAVTIVHDRFGMSSGVTGIVVGLEPDWINARINVKVMV